MNNNNRQTAFIMTGMIEFIKTQGRERVDQIQRQMDEQFISQSEKMV